MTHGYQGGDGEFALIEAYQKLADIEEDDVVAKIKSTTWVMGHIIEIARARGYHLDLGFKGWCFARLGKSSVHANECLKAWTLRHTFDAALAWYQDGNTTWMPSKPTGPRFAIELDKVYRNRMKSEHELLQEATRKKEAAERREQAKAAKQAQAEARWRRRFELLREEHLKWAAETQRESRVLNQIDAEIADEKPGFSPNGTGTTAPEPGDHTEPDPVADEFRRSGLWPAAQVVAERLAAAERERDEAIEASIHWEAAYRHAAEVVEAVAEGPEPDNVVPFVAPEAKPDRAPDENDLDWMDNSLPPVGERTMDDKKPPVGFPGKPGKFDQELAELRQYALFVIKDASLPLGGLVDAPKSFWFQHRDAETVREIWLQRFTL